MNEDILQNQKEAEETTIDKIARFLVISARELHRQEREESLSGDSAVSLNVRGRCRGSKNLDNNDNFTCR